MCSTRPRRRPRTRCGRQEPTTSMSAILRAQTRGRWRRSPLTTHWTEGYLLAGPALLVMIAVLIYPLGYSFVMSFFRWDLSAPSQPFVGLANYAETFTSPQFQQSLRNQIIFS